MGSFPKNVRREAFRRARGKCEDCGRKFDDGWQLDAHHVKPHSFGGPDSLDNAVMLCLNCHRKRHLKLKMYRAAKSIQRRMDLSGGGRTRKWLKAH